MDLHFSSAVFLILSCCLWNAECFGRTHNQKLQVPNGGGFGRWGPIDMCQRGYANGFSLKAQTDQGMFKDDAALTGIRLHCGKYPTVESTTADIGEWGNVKRCASGNLISFRLQVEKYLGGYDDISANNIEFTCQDQSVLEGNVPTPYYWGRYGPWSDSCRVGAICAIRTRIETYRSSTRFDNTGLNDVRFYCCA